MNIFNIRIRIRTGAINEAAPRIVVILNESPRYDSVRTHVCIHFGCVDIFIFNLNINMTLIVIPYVLYI